MTDAFAIALWHVYFLGGTMKKYIIVTLFTSLLSTLAMADTLRLGMPGYGGNGCPGGTASATLSPDGSALSIIFDNFIAEAGGYTGKTMDRKACNISIPVHVPGGMSISFFQIDYRGFLSLPYGSYATFNVAYFFAGGYGPTFNRVFNGGTEDNYLINNDLNAMANVWSPCGADTLLRVNANMRVNTSNGRSASATVDSADIKSGILFHLRTRRC